jgi:hypothetical protein
MWLQDPPCTIPRPQLTDALHGSNLLGLRHHALLSAFRPRFPELKPAPTSDEACGIVVLAWLQHRREPIGSTFSRSERRLLSSTLQSGACQLQTRSPYQLWQLCMAISHAKLPARCFSAALESCNWHLADPYLAAAEHDAIFGSPEAFSIRVSGLLRVGAPAQVLCAFLDAAVHRGQVFVSSASGKAVTMLLQAAVKASWNDINSIKVRGASAPAGDM